MKLDIEDTRQLKNYLIEHGYVSNADRLVICPLKGGVSNRTVFVELPNGQQWVMKQALKKLRVEADWFSKPERIHREALGIHWLGQLTPPGTIPKVIFEDQINHLLAMVTVPQPHVNWKTALLAGRLQDDHVRQFGALLAQIHTAAYVKRNALSETFADRHFFETLRLEPYYAYTASNLSDAAAFLNDLIVDTRQRAITLVHGDYSPKNILIFENKMILLDHEVIHWGDPAFDVGFSMTHLLSKAHHLASQRQQFTQAAHFYWQAYVQNIESTGSFNGMEPFAVRHTMACLLARAAGRSPLEYLSKPQEQIEAVLRLLPDMPNTMPDLIDQFIEGLDD